nr:autophagy protein 5 [Quercus suber]
MPPPPTSSRITSLQSQIWAGSLALEIRLAPSDCRTYDNSEPYLIQYPRLSYLAFLLDRLHAFFARSLIDPEVPAHDAWLSVEDGVPLKWHYPAGLLYDLLSGAEPAGPDTGKSEGQQRTLPWQVTVHYTGFPAEQLIRLDAAGRTMEDSFVNAVKEADFIRNGTARVAMGMSKADSDSLWMAVKKHDLRLFNTINHKFLYPPGMELRHVPMKIYLPTSSSTTTDPVTEETTETVGSTTIVKPAAGHVRVVQSLVPILQPSSRTPQTLGTALNTILPTIFPSRRNPLLAQPVLHGAAVPMGAGLEELGRAATYSDGFLHLVVVMLG